METGGGVKAMMDQALHSDWGAGHVSTAGGRCTEPRTLAIPGRAPGPAGTTVLGLCTHYVPQLSATQRRDALCFER